MARMITPLCLLTPSPVEVYVDVVNNAEETP